MLRVLPSGTKDWLQSIRIGGKRCNLGLGSYPRRLDHRSASARDGELPHRTTWRRSAQAEGVGVASNADRARTRRSADRSAWPLRDDSTRLDLRSREALRVDSRHASRPRDDAAGTRRTRSALEHVSDNRQEGAVASRQRDEPRRRARIPARQPLRRAADREPRQAALADQASRGRTPRGDR